MAHWSGLGYYSRARNLHKAAKMIKKDYGGNFPKDFDQIVAYLELDLQLLVQSFL